MILVKRGKEPDKLKQVRVREIAKLQTIVLSRPPTAKEIKGYKCVAENLWKAQHRKCCYCEKKFETYNNDVEHYRPKTAVDHETGSGTVVGYWWLAFTWKNLLFACDCCNRKHKKIRFPLAPSSTPLATMKNPPGKEKPLLLDPAGAINPVEHIEYVFETTSKKWWPRGRNGSFFGAKTIEVCKLDRPQLVALYGDHVKELQGFIGAIDEAISRGQKDLILSAFQRALGHLTAQSCYVGLTYDVFRHHFPDATLQALIQRSWPEPSEVGK